MNHLIHIGFPKAASTSIRRWFRSHPEIAYAEGGIAGARDVYQLQREALGDAKPAWRVTSSEGFAAPRPDAGSQFVDHEAAWSRPLSERQSLVCRHLSDLFPGAHILIVTRGFRSMALASYSQYVRAGGERDWEDLAGDPDLEPSWNYDELIHLYSNAFGAERVIVMPMELLAEDPIAFADHLSARLGIAEHPMPAERLNPSIGAVALRHYPRLSRLMLALPVGHRLRRPIFRLYVKLLFGDRLAPLAALMQRFHPLPPIEVDAVATAIPLPAVLASNPLYANYLADYSV